MRINDLPGIESLERGDVLDVTLKRSKRVRSGCRGKTYRVVFDRVGITDVTDVEPRVEEQDDGTLTAANEDELLAAIADPKRSGGWVLEGHVGGEDGVLQGFHDWSIATVERVT